MRRFRGIFLLGFILGIYGIAFLASRGFAEIQKTREDKTPHKEKPVQLGKVVVTTFMAIAADERSQVTDLEEITVVGSPVIEANEVDRYASQKTTVTQRQIQDLNAQDVSTALRMAPGVNITQYNMIGSFGGVTVMMGLNLTL